MATRPRKRKTTVTTAITPGTLGVEAWRPKKKQVKVKTVTTKTRPSGKVKKTLTTKASGKYGEKITKYDVKKKNITSSAKKYKKSGEAKKTIVYGSPKKTKTVTKGVKAKTVKRVPSKVKKQQKLTTRRTSLEREKWSRRLRGNPFW